MGIRYFQVRHISPEEKEMLKYVELYKTINEQNEFFRGLLAYGPLSLIANSHR